MFLNPALALIDNRANLLYLLDSWFTCITEACTLHISWKRVH